MQTIRLDGEWNYLEDSDTKFNYTQAVRRFKSNKPQKMTIPINWQLAGLNNFSGSVWYFREFDINAANLKKFPLLEFNGVDYLADVWLNGDYLGNHEGYFSPFIFNVDGKIKHENFLVVKVTSPFEKPGKEWPLKKKLIKGIFNHHDCRPGGWDLQKGQDQNTGGIWNNVELTLTNKIYFKIIKITPKLFDSNKKARVQIEIPYLNSENKPTTLAIKFQLRSPNNKTIVKNIKTIFDSGQGTLLHTFEIDKPSLWNSWDTGKPNLYKIKIQCDQANSLETSFGIRELKLDEKQQFFINGKRLFLRGTNIIPTQFLSEFNKAKINRLVKLLKKANINIVRVHAHVNRKELYDAFDAAGILVWQDFALQWTYDESTEFSSNAVKQIKEMVRHLYNHPSMAFWCCHNEPGEQVKTLDPFLYDAVLSEDNTRIVRIASNYAEHPYDGWYWGSKEHFSAAPMGPLVTEFGAQGVPEKKSLKKIFNTEKLFPPDWNLWKYHNFQADQTFNIAKVQLGSSIHEFISNSQNYQSELIETAINFYRRNRYQNISGIFQFMFIDCWRSITWSLVDYFEKPKLAYHTLQRVYQPIFISVNIRQDQYYPGSKFLLDFFIINDLHKSYEGVTLQLFIGKKKLYAFNNLNLGKDDLLFINYESYELMLPNDIKPGLYRINLQLLSKEEKMISKNNFTIKIVDKL